MKVLTVCTGWMSQALWIGDNAKADAAYEVLRNAMNSYERFDNDKNKSVTIETGDGSSTFRIETLVSATLDDCAAGEATIIERNVWDANIKAKIAARLAPAA